MAKHHVTATVNGDAVEFLCDTQETLLDCLRDQLGLTGTKEGCSTGDCGACSVTVNGRLVCSCLMLAVEAGGTSIGTIEGIARGNELHPLQRKFIEHAALQAVSARRASWSPLSRCSRRSRIRARRKCGSGWQATSAAAPATTRSCARCWTPPPR